MKESTRSTIKYILLGSAIWFSGILTIALCLAAICGLIFLWFRNASDTFQFTNTTDHDQVIELIFYGDDNFYYTTASRVKSGSTLTKKPFPFSNPECMSLDGGVYRAIPSERPFDGDDYSSININLSSDTVGELELCKSSGIGNDDSLNRTWYWTTNNRANITFKDDLTFTGSTGCNSMFGSYITTEYVHQLFISNIGHTEIGCVNYNEQPFLNMLAEVKTYSVEGDNLVITLRDGSMVRFTSER